MMMAHEMNENTASRTSPAMATGPMWPRKPPTPPEKVGGGAGACARREETAPGREQKSKLNLSKYRYQLPMAQYVGFCQTEIPSALETRTRPEKARPSCRL